MPFLAALLLLAPKTNIPLPKVAVGDLVTYRTKGRFAISQGRLTFTGTITTKVKKVDEKKYRTESGGEFTGTLEGFDGEIKIVNSPSELVLRRDGTVTEAAGYEGTTAEVAYRRARLIMFVTPAKPVAVNETWIVDVSANAGIPALSVEYTLLGEEKVGAADCFKVRLKAREKDGEDSAGAIGTVWVEKATGIKTKGVLTLDHAGFGNPDALGDGTIELVREP